MRRMAAALVLLGSACCAPAPAPAPLATVQVSPPEAVAVVDRSIATWRGNRGSGWPEVLSAIEKDRPLAETAASVAATMRLQRAAPLVATLLDDSVGIERGRLLRSLWLLDSGLALPRIEVLARSRKIDERRIAFEALWEASEPSAHAILVRGLEDSAEDALEAAVRSLSSARELPEKARLLAARIVLPRAAPAEDPRAGDATWDVDDLLWRFALQSGWPPETAPRVERFSEENLRVLVSWWEARLAHPRPQ